MINICVQNMIELSVYLLQPYMANRWCSRQIHHGDTVSIVRQ